MSDWIKWEGGECPVPCGSVADVKFRDGTELHKMQIAGHRMASVYWLDGGGSDDIIAYRLHDPADAL